MILRYLIEPPQASGSTEGATPLTPHKETMPQAPRDTVGEKVLAK